MRSNKPRPRGASALPVALSHCQPAAATVTIGRELLTSSSPLIGFHRPPRSSQVGYLLVPESRELRAEDEPPTMAHLAAGLVCHLLAFRSITTATSDLGSSPRYLVLSPRRRRAREAARHRLCLGAWRVGLNSPFHFLGTDALGPPSRCRSGCVAVRKSLATCSFHGTLPLAHRDPLPTRLSRGRRLGAASRWAARGAPTRVRKRTTRWETRSGLFMPLTGSSLCCCVHNTVPRVCTACSKYCSWSMYCPDAAKLTRL